MRPRVRTAWENCRALRFLMVLGCEGSHMPARRREARRIMLQSMTKVRESLAYHSITHAYV